MSCFNCCFLTHIRVSQEWGKVVWYSHLFKNFQQFVVIHTAKGFNIVNEAEVGVFLEFPCFLYDQTNVGNWLLAPLKTDSFPRRDSTLQSCPTLCDPTVQLFAAHQSPLSMGFSRWEYCSGLPCPPPGDLPKPGIKPKPLTSPALAGRFFTTNNTWEAQGDSFPSHPLNESEQYSQMFYMLPPKTKDTYKILHFPFRSRRCKV